MPLRIAESGHPTRCGFGKSWDKPLPSRFNIRFSSALNSSCCLRTRMLSVEIVPKKCQVYRERSVKTKFGNAAVMQRGPTVHEACLLHIEIEVCPEAPSGPDVPQFPSMSIRIAEQPIPCGSNHPSSAPPR